MCDSSGVYYSCGAHPLPCPLQVTAEDLPDLLLAALGQLRQGSLRRLGGRRLLGLNVPDRHNTHTQGSDLRTSATLALSRETRY